MKINKEDNQLVLRLDLKQPSYDALGLHTHNTDNLIGVIADKEFSISQLIDLGYKGSQQEGMPIIMFDTKEDLQKICKEFGLNIWEHELCVNCKSVIRGSCRWEGGPICYECQKD